MENKRDTQIYVDLKNLYEQTENNVKVGAKVKRAYIGKISEELINEKVNNQLNAIKIGINSINPRFKEGAKNFDKTKTLILDTMANYEKALIDMSEFYDGKIEKLILQKVELEASYIGSILNEEYLQDILLETEEGKLNDSVKNVAKTNFFNAFNKLLRKKENNKAADPKVITNMIDSRDIQFEIADSLDEKIEKTSSEKTKNSEFIVDVEQKIASINSEIDTINERKIKSLYDAMEVGEKALDVNIRKPRTFSKITKFFLSRINASKVVETNIISPLNLRIENFRKNELANINEN